MLVIVLGHNKNLFQRVCSEFISCYKLSGYYINLSWLMNKLWIYGLIAIGLFILSAIAGIVGWLNQSVLLGLTYFFLNQYLDKQEFKSAKMEYLLKGVILLPFPILILGMAIYYGEELKHIYPLPFLVILSIIASEISVRLKKSLPSRIKFFISYFVLLLFAGLILFPNYLAFINSSNPYVNKDFPNQEFVNMKGAPIKLGKGKVKVIEMWHTGCSSCFKKFPAFDEFREKYQHNPNVCFYALNIPLPNESFNKRIKITKSKVNFKFKNIFASRVFATNLGINSYPTMLIIDKNNKIKFQGFFHPEPYILVYNPKSILNSLLAI